MVFTPAVNEASPRILEGLKNLIQPDVRSVVHGIRSRCQSNGESARHEAPVVISRGAEWVLANSEKICDVLEAGVENLPMSRPMLLEAFNNCVGRWTEPEQLRSLLRAEAGSSPIGRPRLPDVVFHNLAGNLFVSGWESITQATLLGAGSLVRCSDADRVFPSIWAHALQVANPMFTGMIAVCEWSTADVGRFQVAVDQCDAVLAYGSDDSVRNLQEMVPWNKPFAGHGSTVSVSLITADQLRNNPVEWLAERCAYDFAVYDQQGCLSPRALFLEDKHPRDVDRFVDALYSAALLLQKNLPRGSMSLEDKAALGRARDQVLLDAACGGAGRKVSSKQDPFLLTVKPVQQFSLGPVNRYLDLYLYKDLSEIQDVLKPYVGKISTVGVADPLRPPSPLLADLKVSRICEVGSMQIPPLGWCLDGYRPLQKFFRWQTIQLG